MEPEKAEITIADRQPVIRLASFWQSCVAANTLAAPERPLSAKEMGQLKQLRKYLGEETKNVIGWAVDNWWTFAHLARAEAGLCSQPAQPHIGFLLAHCATAVNIMAKTVPEQVAKLMAEAAKEREEAIRFFREEGKIRC